MIGYFIDRVVTTNVNREITVQHYSNSLLYGVLMIVLLRFIDFI